jgi:HK97 family phage prohead protease
VYLTCKFFPIKNAVPSAAAIKALGRASSMVEAKAKAGNIRIGIASTNALDLVSDIVDPGAFNDAIKKFSGGVRPKFLLNHQAGELPIGRLLSMKMVFGPDLPAELRAKGATSGLMVEKEYFQSQRAKDTLEAADAGEMGMSFGFAVRDSRFEDRDGQRVRILTKLELYEVSDVGFPANPATLAVVSKHFPPQKHEGDLQLRKLYLQADILKSEMDLINTQNEIDLRKRMPARGPRNEPPSVTALDLEIAKLRLGALRLGSGRTRDDF